MWLKLSFLRCNNGNININLNLNSTQRGSFHSIGAELDVNNVDIIYLLCVTLIVHYIYSYGVRVSQCSHKDNVITFISGINVIYP